jgi:branched-chain amino acid transport system ATP-binding protein
VSIELSLQGIRAGYGPVEVLHGVDLEVPGGSVTALLGPNGAGKTTLLSVIAGLVPTRAGEVVRNGTTITDQAPHQRAAAGMLLVPERRGVFPALSVGDNLEIFAGSRHGWDVALETFPALSSRLDQRAGLLSGGEQQMLAMSHALLRRPTLLLLDELSTGLAPRVSRQLFDVVADLAAHGTTIVLVEQHLSDALRLADVVYLLRHGQVAFAGEPSELTDPSLLASSLGSAT